MRKLLLLAAFTLLATTTTSAPPPAAGLPEDWVQAVANHDMLFSASSSSADVLLPVLSNGYLGWTVDSSHLYLSGLYSQNDTIVPPGVYRTRLPSQLSIVPQVAATATAAATATSGVSIDTDFVGAALDLKTGSFLRRYHFHRPLDGANIEVEQRWYAHRAIRSILAMTLTVTTYRGSLDPPFELQLVSAKKNQGADDDEEDDVLFEDISSHYPGLRVLRGKQFQPENATAPTIIISLVSTPVPPSLTVTGNQTWQFVTSIRTTTTSADNTIPSSPAPEQAALDDHRLAKSMASSPELFSLHEDEWKTFYAANGIEIGLSSPSSSSTSYFPSSSSSWLPAAVNASFSTLSSSLRVDFPSGIGRGGLTPVYGGHTFWDSEMWVFPSLLLSAPALAESLLRYRYERLEMALQNAKKQKAGGSGGDGGDGEEGGYEGALFPWESAGTGEEVEAATTDADTHMHTHTDGRAVHVSGAVALAVWQYWLATNDVQWLQEVGFPLLESVADFWVSRAEVVEEVDGKQHTHTQAHIRGVIPPDGFAGVVDDSVYTNVVARKSLRYVSRAASILLQHAAAAAAARGGRGGKEGKENLINKTNKSLLLPPPITRTTTMLALNDSNTHTHTTPLQASIDKWTTLHDQLVILYNHTQGIHPEHQNYTGANIQQSDVILLGYPWQFYSTTHTHTHTQPPGTDEETRKRDFMYYKDKLVAPPSPSPSPAPVFSEKKKKEEQKSLLLGARTWSMQAINALDLGLEKESYHAFLQSYQLYCHPPFGVWTEEEEGGKDVFVTAAGGFLQVLLQGYGGFRLLEAEERQEEGGGGNNNNDDNKTTMLHPSSSLLRFSPQCPPGVKSMKFRHLTFLGNHFALSYTCGDVADGAGDKMTFSLGRREPDAPSLQLVLHKGKKEKEEHFPIFAGQILTLPRQEAWLVNVGEEGAAREETDDR